MLEGSKINSDKHKFIEFNYKFHNSFFRKDFQIFHGCYEKEPFGYSIFDAIDNGKLPIIHSDWMADIDYKYRASNKLEFNLQYSEIIRDGFEENANQFRKLKLGLQKFTNKQKWIDDIYMYIQ